MAAHIATSRMLCCIVLLLVVLPATVTPYTFAKDSTLNSPLTPPLTVVQQQAFSHATTLVELSNGLTVIVAEDHTAAVASVRCFVRNTGSSFEGAWLGSGISHLLEHVVAGGSTTKRTEKEIEHLIERIGGVTNAYTSHDVTCYYIDSTSAYVTTTIELVADMMQRVIVAPEELAREHKVVVQELLDGESDRSRVMWHLLSQNTYRESPVRHPVIGYHDALTRLTRDDAVAFYRERYVPNNMIFVVAGDVNTSDVVAEVCRQFAGTPRGAETLLPLADEPQQLSPRNITREMDGRTVQYAIAFPTIKLAHDDLFALDILASILSEGESSRLVRRLVYDQQLLLSVDAFHSTPHYVRGQFCLLGMATPEKYTDSVTAVLAEVERFKSELVTATELDKAKKQEEADLVFGRQRAKAIASAMGRCFLATGDPHYDDQYVEGIRRVTAEDIRRVACLYFSPERMTRIAITPKGMTTANAVAVTNEAVLPLASHVLPNGLRVFIKRQTNLPLVNIRVAVTGGMITEGHDNAGRASLMTAMLDQGTPTRSAEEIAEYFDAIGGMFSVSCGRYSVVANATILKDDFDNAAAVFADCLLNATFPEKEFDQIKTLTLGSIAHRGDDPISELMEFFAESLPRESIYSRLEEGTVESVNRLTTTDLKQRFAEDFVPANMIVTVFGDVEPDHALAVISRVFSAQMPKEGSGNIAPRELKPELLPPAALTSGARHKTTEKDSGLVLLAYRAPSCYAAEEHAAMRVLSAMLSDGTGPNGWLFSELRGEGLVYRVNTSIQTGRIPGYFLALAQTSPASTSEVVTRIKANIARAIAGDFPQDDLDRAKERIVLQHAQTNVTVAEQSQTVALDVILGFGAGYNQTYPQRIAAVTRDEVVAAANKFLTEPLVITTSP